jgi:hypothetical protein
MDCDSTCQTETFLIARSLALLCPLMRNAELSFFPPGDSETFIGFEALIQ